MIASSLRVGFWPPTTRSATALEVPRWVLAPLAAGVATLPLLKPSGPGNSSPVDVFFAVGIGLALFWFATVERDLRFPYALAGGLFMLGGAVGALAGPLPDAGLLAVVQDLVLLVWCAVLVNVARSPSAFRWLLQAWTWGAFAWALVLIAAVATGNDGLAGITARTGVRASLTFGDPNYAANYFFVSLMIVLATRMPRRRSVRFATCAALVAALGLTGSNGGFLASALGVGVVLLFFVFRRGGVMPLVTAFCAVAIVAVLGLTVAQPQTIEAWARDSGQPLLRDSIGRSSQSAQERAWLITETIGLYEQGAPWGLGPGSTKPLLQFQLAPYAYQTHDDYIESIVERGILGAFGLILLIGSVGIRTWAVVSKPLSPEFAELFPNTSALLGVMVGLAVSASYYQILHFRQVWTVFAIVAALYIWGRK